MDDYIEELCKHIENKQREKDVKIQTERFYRMFGLKCNKKRIKGEK